MNQERVYRLYRGSKTQESRQGVRQPLAEAGCPNQSWSLDFMSDSLYSGQRFRTLNIIDDFNREALRIEVDTSLPVPRVVAVLEQLKDWRGLPKQIRMDNGPELISKELEIWAESNKVEVAFIQSGKPCLHRAFQRHLQRRVSQSIRISHPERSENLG